jgi:hypothetical protein
LGFNNLRNLYLIELDEIRKQELRGEAIHQNKDVKFPEPP